MALAAPVQNTGCERVYGRGRVSQSIKLSSDCGAVGCGCGSGRLSDMINSKHRWIRLQWWCNSDFEGSDDNFFGDGCEGGMPRTVILVSLKLFVVILWPEVYVGDGGDGVKF